MAENKENKINKHFNRFVLAAKSNWIYISPALLVLFLWVSFSMVSTPNALPFYALVLVVLLFMLLCYDGFKLEPGKALYELPLFWVAALLPLYTGLYLGSFIWSFNWQLTGTAFNNFLETSKLPLGIMALGIPFGVMVGSFHRTLQTAEQIRQAESANNFRNYTEHRKALVDDIVNTEEGTFILVYKDRIKAAGVYEYFFSDAIEGRLYPSENVLECIDLIKGYLKTFDFTNSHNKYSLSVKNPELIDQETLDNYAVERESAYRMAWRGMWDIFDELELCSKLKSELRIKFDGRSFVRNNAPRQNVFIHVLEVFSRLLKFVDFHSAKRNFSFFYDFEIIHAPYSIAALRVYSQMHAEGDSIRRAKLDRLFDFFEYEIRHKKFTDEHQRWSLLLLVQRETFQQAKDSRKPKPVIPPGN